MYFAHILPSSDEEERKGAEIYNRAVVTECLTCGSLDAGRAFQNWMEEPGHRASILGKWKYAACGIFGIMHPNGWKIEYYFVFVAGFDPISGNENRETGTERVSGYPVVLAHPEERITGITLDGIVNASGVYVDCSYRDTVTVLATLKIRSVSPGGVHINQIPVTPETFLIQPKDAMSATVSGLDMTALSAGAVEIAVCLKERPSIGGTIRIEVLRKHAAWDWVRQINSTFSDGRLPQASDFIVKDDLGNNLKDGSDYGITCHSEWPSGYVEVVFSFKGNYMGTVQKTVSVPIPEGECGNSPSVPETPGQGEENSQAGNSNNSGGKSMPSVPPARMQSDKSDGSRSLMPARTGIKVKTGDRKSNKTATPTPSKKRTENRSEEVPVRSDLKKPKLRSVKCSKKGSLKISWKKDRKTLKKVNGYEIQVSSDRRFAREVRTVLAKKKASGIRIKVKVKGQKFLYVRIRYYSPRGVSEWSKVKKVRTK